MRGRSLSKVALVFSAASFAAIATHWDALPDPYPTHWNWHGVVDRWTPKPWGPLILPIVVTGLTVLFAITAASQKERRTRKVVRMFAAISTAAMFALTVVTMYAAMGRAVDLALAVPLIVGSLLAALGNYFGKLPRNPIAGIRTPWTLADDEVWLRTHRFGGKLFVLAGVASVGGALVGHGMEALLASALFASIASVTYSYFISRRISSR